MLRNVDFTQTGGRKFLFVLCFDNLLPFVDVERQPGEAISRRQDAQMHTEDRIARSLCILLTYP
jgi:hypothetical protein